MLSFSAFHSNIYIVPPKSLYIPDSFGYHSKMTPKKHIATEEEKHTQLLEEICEHTMAIRRVINRILDHLHEQNEDDFDYHDPDELSWEDMDDYDDMYL